MDMNDILKKLNETLRRQADHDREATIILEAMREMLIRLYAKVEDIPVRSAVDAYNKMAMKHRVDRDVEDLRIGLLDPDDFD